jgi:hypothetical protein
MNTLYCLEEWRGKQRISPPGDNFTPTRGQNSPLGDKFAPGVKVFPRGEVKNGTPVLAPKLGTPDRQELSKTPPLPKWIIN